MVSVGISGLHFAYRKDPVLKNITVDFEPGKLCMIVGANGSGKSTLLKCINGILPAKRGRITIGAQDLHQLSRNQTARLMAYVPQQEHQVFSGTVYETVLMGRKPWIGWAPGKRDHAVVDRVLMQLSLEKVSGAYLDELSGGQRQRVIIGRALTQQPQVLLLDEPTASLDLKHQLEVMLLLKKLTTEKITVIVAIHDLNLAAKYADQVLMLNKGEVFACGDRKKLNAQNIKKLYDVNVEVVPHHDGHLIVPLKPANKTF